MDSELGLALHVHLWARHKPLQVVQWLCGRTALTVAVQEAVLQVLDADPLLASAPLEPAYRQRLVKHLISAVERDSGRAELCEALVGAYTELLAQPPGAPDSTPAGTDRGAVTWMVKTFVYSSGGEAAAASGCLHGSAAFADALAAHAQRLRGALQEPAGEQQRCRGADAAQASAQLAPGDPPGLGLVSLRVSSNVLDGGTGCAEWEAGLVLAEVVLSHPRLVQGRRCLELGCGTGVVGMAAARAGAQHVRLTDGDAGAMANCTFNCRLNGLVADLEEQQQGEAAAATGRSELRGHHKGRVQVERLDWGQCADGRAAMPTADVILASDVLYDPGAIPDLVRLLERLLRPPKNGPQAAASSSGQPWPVVALVATTKRNESTLQLFLSLVAQEGSALALVDVTEQCRAPQGVRFVGLPWLEEARGRVLLHVLVHRTRRDRLCSDDDGVLSLLGPAPGSSS